MGVVSYKAVSKVTREEILEIVNLSDSKNGFGDVFSYERFSWGVNNNFITDDDGYGRVALLGREVINSRIVVHNKNAYIGDKYIIPWKVLYKLFGDEFQIFWYNK